jgi:uncharacterized protein (DUF1800 family)
MKYEPRPTLDGEQEERGRDMRSGWSWTVAAVSGASLILSGCGNGGGGGVVRGPELDAAAAPPAIAATDAARFLTQATYGVTDAEVSSVQSAGYASWIANQETIPQESSQAYVDSRLAAMLATNAAAKLNATNFYETFWLNAATGQDQLRERVKLALSEIFVISLADSVVDTRGGASYYDMLGEDAFANFRTLLQDVTLHPMMGEFLTSLGNQKENTITGQHPDENYAREVMQLMTIGLFMLNPDGSQKLDSTGKPIPTFGETDVSGIAKVFTGMSYYAPTPTATTFFGGARNANWDVTPMSLYNAYHSISEKDFLGATIPATTTANTAGDLKIALDTLFNHPNVGPFVGRQLIQHLVTSNPSPAYVGRVAAVFNNNGAGVRGDMGAVIRAILTDTEARNTASAETNINYGKLREPVVRMANWLRTFGATSQSGHWLVGSTSASTSLDQSALTAGSVFNFSRPGYIPPNTKLAAAGQVAPEFQLVDEVTTAGYLNTMNGLIHNGIGPWATAGSGPDISSAYTNEMPLAANVPNLMARLNQLLFYGQMSAGLQAKIGAAVSAIIIPSGRATAAQINAAELERVKLAIFLSMASAEYIHQR